MKKVALLFILMLSLIPISCDGGQMEADLTKYHAINDVPSSAWEKLSEISIYFGHQSVGYNILHGVDDLISQNPNIKLQMKETYDSQHFLKGQLSHSRIGYNGNPISKIDMFAFFAKNGGATSADIMFFKFCYVDFNKNTNIEELFEYYKSTFEFLQRQFPKTTFIHFTVPLTSIQSGPKTLLKKVLNRPIGGTLENIKRHEFNDMIRIAYTDKNSVFDIAAFESSFPNGEENAFDFNGKKFPYLINEYTNDGGHLNQVGRKRIAEQLLLFLINHRQTKS